MNDNLLRQIRQFEVVDDDTRLSDHKEVKCYIKNNSCNLKILTENVLKNSTKNSSYVRKFFWDYIDFRNVYKQELNSQLTSLHSEILKLIES